MDASWPDDDHRAAVYEHNLPCVYPSPRRRAEGRVLQDAVLKDRA
jgi:hypothetical protein